MKTRILASIITTGILVSSAAQASSAITVEDINASYLNPSFTRNADVSSYIALTQQSVRTMLTASAAGRYNIDPSGNVYSN